MQFRPRFCIHVSNAAIGGSGNGDRCGQIVSAARNDDQIDFPDLFASRFFSRVLDPARLNTDIVGHISGSLVRLALTKVAARAGRVIVRGPSVFAFAAGRAA